MSYHNKKPKKKKKESLNHEKKNEKPSSIQSIEYLNKKRLEFINEKIED